MPTVLKNQGLNFHVQSADIEGRQFPFWHILKRDLVVSGFYYFGKCMADSILWNSFAEIWFTDHRIHTFEAQSPEVFSVFTELCNQHRSLILEHCHHPKRNPVAIRLNVSSARVSTSFRRVPILRGPSPHHVGPGLFPGFPSAASCWGFPWHTRGFQLPLPLLSVRSFIPSEELKDWLFSIRMCNAHDFNVIPLITFIRKSKLTQPCQGS